jgi:hypothetical protein
MEPSEEKQIKKTEILPGDEVIFLGKSNNSWSSLKDYGILKEGEAYVVHFSTPYNISLVGVPGLFDKSLFECI